MEAGRLALELEQEKKEKEEIKLLREKDMPYVEVAQNLIYEDTGELISVSEAAKHFPSIGRNNMFKFLNEKGLVFKNENGSWEAYQKYVRSKHFINKQEFIPQKGIYVTVIKVTKRGLAAIERIYNKSKGGIIT